MIGQDFLLVWAFIIGQLHYRNSFLIDHHESAPAPLQRVQNADARLILDLPARDCVCPEHFRPQCHLPRKV